MSSQLQTLSDKFNALLTQYTNTYQEYISLVNSNRNSLTSVPNSSFFSQRYIKTLNNSTLDACKAACESNSSCSGATFNNSLRNCTINSGAGRIVPTTKSTAIAKQAMYYSYQLQQLNSQLTKINQQMMKISNSSHNNFQKSQQYTQQREQALQNNYQVLSQERYHIDEMVREFQTIDAAYNDGTLVVTANYYNYIVLVFVVVFLIFLFMKFSLFGEQRGGGGSGSNISNNSLFIFIILSVIIIFNSFIKK
jgi:lipopolysaccharide export LptBFGC system permease protein LptF